MKEKELSADAVLFNNGPVEETESQLTEVLSKWNAEP